jgi:hypothetical protein
MSEQSRADQKNGNKNRKRCDIIAQGVSKWGQGNEIQSLVIIPICQNWVIVLCAGGVHD